MSTDYGAIYDHVITTDARYNAAENSPGYQACLLNAERLRAARGPSLDVGCGVGFVVELLGGPMFGLEAWGVDVSRVGVERARARLGHDRVVHAPPGPLPFPDERFGLVTCFDVFEHLDEGDARPLARELRRVLRPGGLLFTTVSCRPAGIQDQFGDNLHRTVRGPEWWAELLTPDEYTVRRASADMLVWWRKP